jgi:fumarate reductase flavoprotein subunit
MQVSSDSGIAAPRTVLQEKWGIEDSEELMVEDMLKAGLRINDLALVKTVVAHANDALEWTKAH